MAGLFKSRGFFLACILVLFSTSAHAQEASKEYKLKAALIYKFVDYVTWPENMNNSPEFIMCFTGRDKFYDSLDPLRTKKVKGKKISLRKNVRPSEIDQCNILFVSSNANGDKDSATSDYEREIIRTSSGKPILTIGESDSFAEEGGIIGFYPLDSKIRFKINKGSATKSGLVIGSDLLGLSKVINE